MAPHLMAEVPESRFIICNPLWISYAISKLSELIDKTLCAQENIDWKNSYRDGVFSYNHSIIIDKPMLKP